MACLVSRHAPDFVINYKDDKMATGDRFYLTHWPGSNHLPAYLVAPGVNVRVSGLVVTVLDTAETLALLLPSADGVSDEIGTARPTLDEWAEFIRQSDAPSILAPELGKVGVALHRKVRFEISGLTQQKVWVRDAFQCMYCRRPAGYKNVQLTIDHFVPLERGGANTDRNYLSACKACNKRKGAMKPEDFCTPDQYAELVEYLAAAVLPA